MKFIRGFGRFWYDFLIGDDWKIAAFIDAVTVCLRLTRLRHHHDRPFDRFVPFDDSGLRDGGALENARCRHVPEQNRGSA